jgi:hypothetical protein
MTVSDSFVPLWRKSELLIAGSYPRTLIEEVRFAISFRKVFTLDLDLEDSGNSALSG